MCALRRVAIRIGLGKRVDALTVHLVVHQEHREFGRLLLF